MLENHIASLFNAYRFEVYNIIYIYIYISATPGVPLARDT